MSLYSLARNWWWAVLRGLFAVVFVVAAFFGTYSTLRVLVLLFGFYALADGLVVTLASLTHSHAPRAGWITLMEGLLGIGAGVLSFLSPGLAIIGLVYLIAGWVVVSGLLGLSTAIWLRSAAAKAGLLAFGAALAVTLGALLVRWPQPVAVASIWLCTACALIFGILQIRVGFQMRSQQIR